MRYVENKRPKPNHYAAMPKAKQLRAEYLSKATSNFGQSLQNAARAGFDALTQWILPEPVVEQRRRRKARAQRPFVLGNVQGVSMSIPARPRHRHA